MAFCVGTGWHTVDAMKAPNLLHAATGFPTALVAGGALVAGYGLARVTRRRPLGAIPLAAGGAWCTQQWRQRGGWGVAAGLLGTYLAAFGGSHPLAKRIGSWPSVAVAASTAAGAAWLASDRPARHRG